jgi:hypothetical protein
MAASIPGRAHAGRESNESASARASVSYLFSAFILALQAHVFKFLSGLFPRFFRIRLDFFFFSSILFYLAGAFF